MEAQIREMVPSRTKTEDLAIRHVGQPGQRVPIAGIPGVERPAQALEGQPALNLGVLGQVSVVIIINEIAIQDRPIHDQGQQEQRESD